MSRGLVLLGYGVEVLFFLCSLVLSLFFEGFICFLFLRGKVRELYGLGLGFVWVIGICLFSDIFIDESGGLFFICWVFILFLFLTCVNGF